MDNDQKPKSTGEKQPDKKSSPQGGNLVWYMLGLGVLLLLIVTMFTNSSSVTLGYSDLLKLIEASGKDSNGKEGRGYVDIVDSSTTQPQHVRISDLSDIVVGSSNVTFKVTRTHFTPTGTGAATTEKDIASAGDKDKAVEKSVELK